MSETIVTVSESDYLLTAEKIDFDDSRSFSPAVAETLNASLNAASLTEAQLHSSKLPEMAYMARLVGNRAIAERFNEDLSDKERTDLLTVIDQDIINLAAKTLPIETFAKLEMPTATPLDDMGFSRPPRMNEVIEAGLAWDITRTDTSLGAVIAMNEKTDDSTSKKEIGNCLSEAYRSGESFKDILYNLR